MLAVLLYGCRCSSRACAYGLGVGHAIIKDYARHSPLNWISKTLVYRYQKKTITRILEVSIQNICVTEPKGQSKIKKEPK